MAVELFALGTVDGVAVRAAPVRGVVWDRGALVRLDEGEVAWDLPAERPPLLAAAGRRLYVAADEWLACVDLRSGAEVWAVELGAPPTALEARAEGVTVAAEGGLTSYDPHGRLLSLVPVEGPCRAIRSVGAGRYVATPRGIYRLLPNERPAMLYACAPSALHDRDGALQALAQGPGGTVLVEDEGLPLVWRFPDAEGHHLAPWGRVEWAVAPRSGRGGVWVVDRRIQTRWQVPLPGVALGLAVVGRSVAVLVDDDGPVLALTHPDVSRPLLLALDGGEALHGEGSTLYVRNGGGTTMFRIREA